MKQAKGLDESEVGVALQSRFPAGGEVWLGRGSRGVSRGDSRGRGEGDSRGGVSG